MSESVRARVARVIQEVLREIDRLEAGFVRRFDPPGTEIWWEQPGLQLRA